MNALITKMLQLPEVKDAMAKQFIHPVGSPPEAAQKTAIETTNYFLNIARRAGIQPE